VRAQTRSRAARTSSTGYSTGSSTGGSCSLRAKEEQGSRRSVNNKNSSCLAVQPAEPHSGQTHMRETHAHAVAGAGHTCNQLIPLGSPGGAEGHARVFNIANKHAPLTCGCRQGVFHVKHATHFEAEVQCTPAADQGAARDPQHSQAQGDKRFQCMAGGGQARGPGGTEWAV
jgi:hypothetical protein